MERNMKASFWMSAGVLIAILMFCPLVNAGGGTQPPIATPVLQGWWQVSRFGNSIDQNKWRGVVAEDLWAFVDVSTCDQYDCYSYFYLFREDAWITIGSGTLTVPTIGSNFWFSFYFYETGNNDNWYGNLFYFGNEMEGAFTNDRWDCSVSTEYFLVYRSVGRITFKK